METNLEPSQKNRIHNNSGRVMAGLVLVIVGIAVLARQMGVDLPYWLFTWPMILVGIIMLAIGYQRRALIQAKS